MAQPIVVKSSHDFVTLRWSFSNQFVDKMEEIKSLFLAADTSGDGQLHRDELINLIDGSNDISKGLRSFLNSKVRETGIDLDRGLDAIFDEIEMDDNEMISIQEFESFLLSLGWCNTSFDGGKTGGPAKLKYIVERCISEFDSRYETALETSSSQGTIAHLKPGQSYRFRVCSVNLEGERGPFSPPV